LANSYQKGEASTLQADKTVKLWFVALEKSWIFLALLAFKIEAAQHVKILGLVTIKEKCFHRNVLQKCGIYHILIWSENCSCSSISDQKDSV